ncbi:MAG: hypothetical protein LBF74_04750 [Treponema sp.]|jgi:hypothetical protein|nr:hypothetical protein [Treponema sp.]
MKKKLLVIISFAGALFLASCSMVTNEEIERWGRGRSAEGFVHPGVVYSQENFDIARKLVEKWEVHGNIPAAPPADDTIGNAPDRSTPLPDWIKWRDKRRELRRYAGEYRAYRSWQKLKSKGQASAGYSISAAADNAEYLARSGDPQFIGVMPEGAKIYYAGTFDNDFFAAYLNGVMYNVTQDVAHAEKAFDILDRYSRNLKGLPGSIHSDTRLLVGLQGGQIAMALELIRHPAAPLVSPFNDADFQSIDRMLRDIWIPRMERFFAYPPETQGNVDCAMLMAYLGMGVALEDRDIYDKALLLILDGENNGGFQYIHNETGQLQENHRDASHPALGVLKIGGALETAWIQGDDLYSVNNNEFLRGLEFYCQLMLGADRYLPWDPFWQDVTRGFNYNTSPVLGDIGRQCWELPYNHYFKVKGLETMWLEARLVQDGEGDDNAPDSGPSYSSFLLYRP